jgi:hypothetical protein
MVFRRSKMDGLGVGDMLMGEFSSPSISVEWHAAAFYNQKRAVSQGKDTCICASLEDARNSSPETPSTSVSMLDSTFHLETFRSQSTGGGQCVVPFAVDS